MWKVAWLKNVSLSVKEIKHSGTYKIYKLHFISKDQRAKIEWSNTIIGKII